MNSLLLMHRDFLPDRNELAILASYAARLRVSFGQVSHEYLINDSSSRFFGRGLEFEELRAYQPGDDIRTIDWRATARTGKPHIKKYREERQQVMMLMLEMRDSMLFGTGNTTKCAQAVRVAALLAFAMRHGHDRVGALLWGDFGSFVIPPSAAADTLNQLLNVLSGSLPHRAGEADWSRHLDMMPRGRKLVFISDFIHWCTNDWHLMDRIRGRHEVFAVHIRDPREEVMPDIGLARITGVRGKELVLVDTGHKSSRDTYAACWKAHMDTLRQRFSDTAIPVRCVSTRDSMACLGHCVAGLIS